jgi:hypothetical protein
MHGDVHPSQPVARLFFLIPSPSSSSSQAFRFFFPCPLSVIRLVFSRPGTSYCIGQCCLATSAAGMSQHNFSTHGDAFQQEQRILNADVARLLLAAFIALLPVPLASEDKGLLSVSETCIIATHFAFRDASPDTAVERASHAQQCV